MGARHADGEILSLSQADKEMRCFIENILQSREMVLLCDFVLCLSSPSIVCMSHDEVS